MQSDEQLLAAAREGDEAAFTLLYRRRQGPVYRFALHVSGDQATAEDVTQETFLALLEKGARFNEARGALLSFLYGIARNLVRRRGQKKFDGLQDLPANDLPARDQVHDDLTRREAIEHVRRAVSSLPRDYREVVALCDLEGASYEEAAVALDCPVGTVRSRLSRARALLAQKLHPAFSAAHERSSS
jgi:RNA polymerase sigma-70 factor, ECF subfamily